jgi:hypothetical protein
MVLEEPTEEHVRALLSCMELEVYEVAQFWHSGPSGAEIQKQRHEVRAKIIWDWARRFERTKLLHGQ